MDGAAKAPPRKETSAITEKTWIALALLVIAAAPQRERAMLDYFYSCEA